MKTAEIEWKVSNPSSPDDWKHKAVGSAEERIQSPPPSPTPPPVFNDGHKTDGLFDFVVQLLCSSILGGMGE